MHYHCEIVIPPKPNAVDSAEEYVRAVVSAIMSPFDENRDDGEGRGIAFWDWWVIGGRWAGAKLLHRLGKERLDAFYAWLKEAGVTVSGLQMGKQELMPADQVPAVDARWNEMFPEAPGPCPIFAHSNDQYGAFLAGDIGTLAETPRDLKCERVIFTGPSWAPAGTWTGPVVPTFMLSEDVWNGYNHMPIAWDGTFGAALGDYLKKLEDYKPEYAQAMRPTDDWLVVTVDYHL